jgi:hypothetical protein
MQIAAAAAVAVYTWQQQQRPAWASEGGQIVRKLQSLIRMLHAVNAGGKIQHNSNSTE